LKGNIYDTLNLLHKVTPYRFLNGLKLLAGYYWSRWTKSTFHPAWPVSLSIEPTTSCNLRCPECPSGLRSFTRPTGMIDIDLYKKIIDEQHRHLLYLLLYFQGEPLLHSQFFDLISHAVAQNIYTATSTNAHFLNRENARKIVNSGLDRLIISIDGTDQHTYEQYRIGGKLEKVLSGTQNVIYWKKKLKSKKPYVIFQYLVVGPNEHQIEDVRTLAKKMGVDKVAFKTAQVYNYKKGSPLIPKNEKYARYKRGHDGHYHIKNRLDDHCWKMWHASVITWDGKVVPCCFDKDASHEMGNINEASFASIWNSKRYRQFRRALLHSRKSIDICRNCTEGTKIWG